MGDERTLQDELRAQRAVVEHQGGIIEAQGALLEELAARPARIEVADPDVGHGGGPPVARPRAEVDGGATDRRWLLARAASVAARAVVGGAALTVAQGSPAAAVISESGNPAVSGTASPTDGIGVRGVSESGTGVFGSSSAGRAVTATTVSGTQLQLSGSPVAPPASSTNRSEGALVKDSVQDLWYCVATGTPGETSAAGGLMSVYANGIAFPGTSNLNWSGPGQTIAVTTITGVDAEARCAGYAGSVTDVVVDALGYYR